MNKTVNQVIQLNTNLVPIFSGTYETIWEVIEHDDAGNELEVDYKHEDLMQSIAKVYQEKADYIKSELGINWIKKIQFNGTFYSPREYNFKTDQLDFEIEVNKNALITSLQELKDNQEFATYLRDHFTSRDGFWSFTPNNYNELSDQIISEGDEFEQSIGALVTFLAEQYGKQTGRNITIEMDIHEDWQGNGYGGLDYKIIE